LQRAEESRQAFQKAITAARTVHPEFQSGWLPGLKKVAAEVR
jgi:hypothetical protein